MGVWSNGLIATAAGLGGIAGGATQNVQDIEAQQAFDRATARDKLLSDLKNGEFDHQIQANLAALPQRLDIENSAAVDKATAMLPVEQQSERQQADIQANQPRVMAPGSTLYTPYQGPGHSEITLPPDASDDDIRAAEDSLASDAGSGATTFTAPTRLSPEQRDYYESGVDYRKAQAARMQAETDAITRGERYRAQQQSQPRFVKDQAGNLVDENSGAYGQWVERQVVKPGVTHTFGKDEPPVYAPAHYEWFDAKNLPLPGGIASLYPNWRGGGQPTQPAAPPSSSPTPPAAPSNSQNQASATQADAQVANTSTESVAPPPAASPYQSADDVRAAYKTGQLSRDQAKQQLTRFGYSSDQPPADYPDARKAPDGAWYVQRGQSFYRVVDQPPAPQRPSSQATGPSTAPVALAAAPTKPAGIIDAASGASASGDTTPTRSTTSPQVATGAEAIGLQLDAARKFVSDLGTPPPIRKADQLAAWTARHDAAIKLVRKLEDEYQAALGDAGSAYVGARIGGLR
jgi:hypothetical protein